MRSFRLYRGGPLGSPLTALGSYLVLLYLIPTVILAVATLVGWLSG